MGYDYGKIWVVGAEGRVGSVIREMLDGYEADLLETDMEDVDITCASDVALFAAINRPNTIINCAGLTDVRLCEENIEQAYKVNALGVRNLSAEARKLDARIIQLSTDDIFHDTKNTVFHEFDTPNPKTVYGKSKLAGENFVKELAPKHLIIRSSWVYGKAGDNFVNSILEQSKTSDSIELPEEQYASPTSAKELARVILRLMRAEQEGVYHAVCKGVCSRRELAGEILRLTGRGNVQLLSRKADESVGGASCAEYTVLDNLMLRMCNIETPVTWEEALAEYIEKEHQG